MNLEKEMAGLEAQYGGGKKPVENQPAERNYDTQEIKLPKSDLPEREPFAQTMETLGADKAEGSGEYKEIGEARLAAATEKIKGFGTKVGSSMAKAWGKISSFGSKTAAAGRSAISYGLAIPEMASAASEKVGDTMERAGDKIAAGAEYVSEKVEEGKEKAVKAGAAAAKSAFETGVAAAGAVKEGAVYVRERSKQAYESAVNTGKEKYAALQARAEKAKDSFEAAVEEAKANREAKKKAREIIKDSESYAKALRGLKLATQRVAALEARMGLPVANY